MKQVLVLKQQRTLSDFGGRMPTQILPSRASRIQSEGQQIRDDEQNITPDELIDMYVSDKGTINKDMKILMQKGK